MSDEQRKIVSGQAALHGAVEEEVPTDTPTVPLATTTDTPTVPVATTTAPTVPVATTW